MTASRPLLWIWPTTTFRGLAPLRFSLQLVLTTALVALLSACPSKVPVAQAPPPPPPPAPTASINATPATVEPGQPITITWNTENATDVAIAQIGAVQPSGSQTLTPTESTTYHITAKGPGGVQEADARVTVVSSAAAAEQPVSPGDTTSSNDAANRLDVFFDLDDYSIRPDQFTTIQTDVQFLKEHPEMRIVVEGHCDEMGSTEYNLVLGDKRATQVKDALQKAGISSVRIRVVSYGKELPVCTEETESCWRMNRRAHITPDIQR